MPIYEYKCKKCGHRFERIQKFSDPHVKKCPDCGGAVEQVISAPAVQFNHRMVAYAIVVAAVGIAAAGLNSRVLMGQSRGLALAVAIVAIFQATLGAATLVSGVPLPLAMGHQAGAALLLIVATMLAWRVRRV